LDALSANWGHGGTGGSGGKGHGGSSGAGKGGSSASAGLGEGGLAGESGEAGEAGAPANGGSAATGGKGGSGATGGKGGSGPAGGSSGTGGSGGASCVCGGSQGGSSQGGSSQGGGTQQCTDLSVGTPVGDTGVTDCGACGVTCSTEGSTKQVCTSGVCVTPTCMPLYADCNSDAQPVLNDGCETFLDELDHCTTDCTAAAATCDPAKVCNAGTCVAPDGLVVLSTPMTTMSTDATRFSDIFPNYPLNLESTTVTVRVYAPGATGGTINVFFSDQNSGFGPETQVDLATISQKWTDITIPGVSAGSYNGKIVKQLNLRIQGGPPSVTDPTVVYVDWVRTSNPLVNDTFDTGVSGFVKSGLIAMPGSSLSWVAALP
jgi:hypothetical protein